jgi:hypothetical protein
MCCNEMAMAMGFANLRRQQEKSRTPAEEAFDFVRLGIVKRAIEEQVGAFYQSLFKFFEGKNDVFHTMIGFGLKSIRLFGTNPGEEAVYLTDDPSAHGLRMVLIAEPGYIFLDIIANADGSARMYVSCSNKRAYNNQFMQALIPLGIFAVPDSEVFKLISKDVEAFDVSKLIGNDGMAFLVYAELLSKRIALLQALVTMGPYHTISLDASDQGWMNLSLEFDEGDTLDLKIRFNTEAGCLVQVKFGAAYRNIVNKKLPDEEVYTATNVIDFNQRVNAHRANARTWNQTLNPFSSQLISMDRRLNSMLTPPPLQSALDVDEDGCCIFVKPAMDMTFLLWDCSARDVTMGCCAVDKDSVYVVLHYDDALGATRVFKGEAWAADAASAYEGRSKARLGEVLSFFTQMRAEKGVLKAHIVFDGQLSVEKVFDLHLHFDHPVEKRSLLVKNVATGSNPLLVIDSFGCGV